MTSAIDPTKPTTYVAFTNDVRNNFRFAHDEITALQNATATSAPLNSPVFTGDPQAPTPAPTDNDQSIATTAFVKAQGYLTGNQTITISGDNTGSGTTAIATTTTGLQGRPLAATAPSLNQVLQWNGSTWLPATVAAGGGASVTISDTAPASPHPGDLWWDSVGGQLYVYYQDPNTSQWVPTTNQAGLSLPVSVANGGTGATTAPAALTNLGAAPTASPTFTGTVTIPPGAAISGYAPLASPAFTGTPSLPTGTTGITQTAGNNSTSLATTAFVGTALGGYLPLVGGQLNPGGLLVGAAGTVPGTGSLTLNANTVTPPAMALAGQFRIVAADGALGVMEMMSAPANSGGLNLIQARSSNGTIAAPTPTANNNLLLSLRGQGYGTSAWGVTNAATVEFYANEGWTASAQGTRMVLSTSPNGTTSPVSSLILAGNTATIQNQLTVGTFPAGASNWYPFNTPGDFGAGCMAAAGGAQNGITATTNWGSVEIFASGTAVPWIELYAIGGTYAAPTPAGNGRGLGVIAFYGTYNTTSGTDYQGSGIVSRTTEAWSATNRGTYLQLQTTPTGTSAMVNSLTLQGNSATFSGTVSIPANNGFYLNGAAGGSAARILSDGNSTFISQSGAGGSFIVQNSTGSVNQFFIDNAGNLAIFGGVGTKASGTTWSNPSSRDIKEDIQPYDKGLQAVLALKPVTYKFRKDSGLPQEGTHIGLVHDQTGHMPEMHTTAVIGGTADKPGREVDALDCSAITFALCNAIKELKAEIDDLKAKLDSR